MLGTLFLLPLLVAHYLVKPVQTYRLRCVADTNLSSYDTERTNNYGASTRLRLKGTQMLGLFRFDVELLRHKRVQSARLFLRYAGNDRKLRIVGVSTLTVPWDEGDGAGVPRHGQPCFEQARLGEQPWARNAADFADVIFMSPNIFTFSEVRSEEDDWISVEVPPQAVQATVAGVATGLVVTDEKGQTFANNDVFSREQSGSAPYLMVTASDLPHQLAPRVSAVQAKVLPPGPLTRGSDVEVRYGASVETLAVRCRITSAQSPEAIEDTVLVIGQTGPQTHVFRDLPRNTELTVTLWGVAPNGLEGSKVSITLTTPATPQEPQPLPASPTATHLAPCPRWKLGNVTVTAGPPDERRGADEDVSTIAGPIWDGQQVRLSVLRGERAACMLFLQRGDGDWPDINLSTEGNLRGHTFLAHYMRDGRLLPAACVPVSDGSLDGSESSAGPATSLRQLLIEFDVPDTVSPGVHRQAIKLSSSNGHRLEIPVAIAVHSEALPTKDWFVLSLNTYGSPARVVGKDPATPEGISAEHAYHALARRHHAVLMPLGYSHSGSVEPGYAPTTDGEGTTRRVTDWSLWDKRFGPLLDGRTFREAGLPDTPLEHLYLPFHEAWPEDIRTRYRFQPSTADYPALFIEHAMKAGPIEQMFPPEYAEGVRRVVKDFADHFAQMGWRNTRFHFFLNNKYFYRNPADGGRGTSWWLLDEPMDRDDWLALRYYGRILREALGGRPDTGIIFRADVSRPQWQRDYLDGLADLLVLGGELYLRPHLMRRLREEQNMSLWHYGSAPSVGQPLSECEAWPVQAFFAGADGIVPWESLGRREHYERAEETALILPGRTPDSLPVATLRLKALERGVVTVEYLKLLAARTGWNRRQLAAAVAPYLEARDFAGLRAAVRDRLADMSAQSRDLSQFRQRPGQARVARPRSPRPKP